MTIHSMLRAAACVSTLTALAGCMSMSGTGGKSEMTCAAPEGVPCQSVSGVYANALAGNLPRAVATPSADPAAVAAAGQPTSYRRAFDASGGVGAIRSEPTVIRIWFAPWEDNDGDLHEDSRVYLQIDAGRWLIEHNRERIRDTFAPKSAARALPGAPTAPAPAAGSAALTGASMQHLVPPSAQAPSVAPTAPQEPMLEGS